MKHLFQLCTFFACALLSFAPRPGEASPTTSEVYAQASDGTPLTWTVFAPAGEGPWPAVLVIHGGRFVGGDPEDAGVNGCAQDLANAGFIAFAIDHRLAPPGSIPGQTSSGQFPDQYDDVHLAVQAARNDSRSNGQVGAVGGSSGGTHAAWVASTGTPGDDRLDVAVCLSGSYDFSDFTPDPDLEAFIAIVTNYVGVTFRLIPQPCARLLRRGWSIPRSHRSFSWTRLATQFPLRNSATWSRNSMRSE